MMHVREVMTKEIQCCTPEESLDRAAQLMWDYDCGCLPVCTQDGAGSRQTVGVLTDRDICMHALFQGKALHELCVREAMAKEVHVCQASDTLEQAERTMRRARIRRLPVLDDGEGLIGFISLADLAREAARERGKSSREITDAEVGDTLASICEPARPSLAV